MGKLLKGNLLNYWPWVVGGVVVYEGYFLVTGKEPWISPDPIHNFLKGIYDGIVKFFGATPPTANQPPCGGKTCATGTHLNTTT